MENAEKAVPKFTTVITGGYEPDTRDLDKLISWCAKFHEAGLAPSYGGGTFGNLSYRIEKGKPAFVITASAVGLKNKLTHDEFVEVRSVNFETMTVTARGSRNPSSESILHHAIYQKRNDINAVFHGHCEEILNSRARLKIMSTEREEPYGSVELVNGVLALIGDRKIIIMKNHGFIAIGGDMDEAGKIALDLLGKC